VACWRAIECCKSRWRTCELNAAGVASVSEDVTTSPVLMPFALAASIKVAHGRSSGVTAIWRQERRRRGEHLHARRVRSSPGETRRVPGRCSP
jgi:hypothetical protein